MTKPTLLFIVVLAAAGCYKPGYEDCAITCASGACPSGLSCVAGMCREPGATGACGAPGDGPSGMDARIDAPPNSDPDQDGVMTAQDNCPFVANRNQANEDGDPAGDACDPCPPIAGQNANSDGDGDGVGDACDPNPGVGGDRILVFEGFSDPTMLAPGVTSLGNWTYSGGTATFQAPQSQDTWIKWNLNPVPARTTIRAAGTITNIMFGGGSIAGAGTLDGMDMGGGAATVCVIGNEGGGTVPRLLLASTNGTNYAIMAANGPLGQPQQFEQSRSGNPPTQRCTALPAAANPAVATISTLPGPGSGLYARGADGRFEWVMIVGSP